MVQKNIHKKMIVLVIVFFGEILISLSDKAITMSTDESTNRLAVSKRLENQISSYPAVDEPEKRISEFIEKWDIAGASVAITKDERLIYAKGFGYADKEAKQTVEPQHLFRVASISKLITSIAVMQLKEQGAFTLDQKVFGEEGILNNPEYRDIKDNRVKEITVRHLLTHSAGWAQSSGDPVFMPYTIKEKMNVSLPVDIKTTIEYTLENVTLDFEPGSQSSYSNLGYAILGEIIEKVSGMAYEDYVISKILNPIGIYDMHLGYAEQANRFTNEVSYYSNTPFKKVYSSLRENEIVLRQYGGNNFEVLGAAGAWVASPAELMKLLAHIDGLPGKKDILAKESIEEMVHSKNGFKPIGWISADHRGLWRRTGTLAGTTALLKRQPNGVSWVMLLNTSNKHGHDFTDQMDSVMTKFLSEVENWPEYDLFNYSNPTPLYSFNEE